MIQNLSQLKKKLKPGSRFEVVNHCRPECIGQIREITLANTAGFYSKDATNPENDLNRANGGKGNILWWEKATNWGFQDGLCSFYTSEEHTDMSRVFSFKMLDEQAA